MTETHPVIMALKLELEKPRSNISDIPMGSIQVSLSLPVQTNPQTITFKAGINAKGVTILVAHLTAFHTTYKAKKTNLLSSLKNFDYLFFSLFICN